MNIERKVFKIVGTQLGIKTTDLTRELHFFNDLSADSLDAVELIMEFEDEFEMVVPDEDAEKIHTIGQVIDYIAANENNTTTSTNVVFRKEPKTADAHDCDIRGDVTQGLLPQTHHIAVGCKVYHAVYYLIEMRLEIIERPDLCIYGQEFPELVVIAQKKLSESY